MEASHYEYQPRPESYGVATQEVVTCEPFRLFKLIESCGHAGPVEMFRTYLELEMPIADRIRFSVCADFSNTAGCCTLFPETKDCPLDLSLTSHVKFRRKQGDAPNPLRDPGRTFLPAQNSTYELVRLQLSRGPFFEAALESAPDPESLKEGQLHFRHFAPIGQRPAILLALPSDQGNLEEIYARFVLGNAAPPALRIPHGFAGVFF